MQLTDIIRKRCESGNKSLFQVIQSVFNGKVKPPPPYTHTHKRKRLHCENMTSSNMYMV